MHNRFVLVSCWHLGCSIDAAWQRVSGICRWPQWWPNVRAVEVHGVHGEKEPGAAPRIGDTASIDWRTRLGYGLRTCVTTTGVLPPCELEGAAAGDLNGRGLWLLEADTAISGVVVTYRWDVHLNRTWMHLAAPLLRPAFAWNHFDVMRAGARGMACDIGCPLLNYRDYRFAPGEHSHDLRGLPWLKHSIPHPSTPHR